MQDSPHVLRCSNPYIMHVFIVDRLFGSMFTKGSWTTADMMYANVLLCILLIIYILPLQRGRERIIKFLQAEEEGL